MNKYRNKFIDSAKGTKFGEAYELLCSYMKQINNVSGIDAAGINDENVYENNRDMYIGNGEYEMVVSKKLSIDTYRITSFKYPIKSLYYTDEVIVADHNFNSSVYNNPLCLIERYLNGNTSAVYDTTFIQFKRNIILNKIL